MSTVVPPDDRPIVPCSWTIIFDDGSSFPSEQGLWSDVADLVMIDGLQVWQTREPVRAVLASSPEQCMLIASEPLPFFAYKRETVALEASPQEEPVVFHATWLYTCFGYVLPAYRVTMTVSSSGCLLHVNPRSTPFSL